MLSEIKLFVNWIRQRNPDARTWRDYSYDLHMFIALFGDLALSEITYREIDQFVNHQIRQGFSPSTINRRLASLTSLYNYFSDEYEEIPCPIIPRRHQLRERQRLPRPVQETALKAFFLAIENTVPPKGKADCKLRDRAMFMLMLRCGLRISEVAKLLLCDLFFDEFHPRILARGKNSMERTVYLSSQTIQALEAYLAVRPAAKDDHVFLSYQKASLSTTAIHKRLMVYREAAAVTFSAHNLRHSFANDLLNADVPVTTIQKLLGHRWLETTQNYVQANDKMVAADYYEACSKMEDWI